MMSGAETPLAAPAMATSSGVEGNSIGTDENQLLHMLVKMLKKGSSDGSFHIAAPCKDAGVWRPRAAVREGVADVV